MVSKTHKGRDSMQLRQTHTDIWETRAEKVLSHFNITAPDEINIGTICWRYGIKILPMDEPREVDAYSLPHRRARRGKIYIKEGLDPIRKKLLLAEEFCHVYLHQVSQLTSSAAAIHKQEAQAKRMAAHLLMPERFICDIYEAAIDEAVLISNISDYFLVTDEFAHYRMELIFNHKVDAIAAHGGKLGTFEWI